MHKYVLALLMIIVSVWAFAQNNDTFLEVGAGFNASRTEIANKDPSMALGVHVKGGLLVSSDVALTLKIQPAAKAHGFYELDGAGRFRYGSNFIINNYLTLSKIKSGKDVTWDYGLTGLLIYDVRFNTATRRGSTIQISNHRIFPGIGITGGALIDRIKIDAGYYLPADLYTGFLGLSVGYRF